MLPKPHSMELAVPDAAADMSAISSEDIHKKGGESGAESEGLEPDRPKRRGRSPFRFFKKKDEKGLADEPRKGLELSVREPSMRASATQLVPPTVPDRPSALSPERAGSPRRLSRVPTEVVHFKSVYFKLLFEATTPKMRLQHFVH